METKFKLTKNIAGAIKRKAGAIAGAASAVALNLLPNVAMAIGPTLSGSGKSIGTLAGNVTNSISGTAVVITALAYLAALIFGFVGAMKWKAYGEQPDRTPLKIPLTYWGIASVCAALPEFIGTGIVTLWGTGATLVAPI